MTKPAEELTCLRKDARCHPLDLLVSGGDLICCGAHEAIGERVPGAVGPLPYCLCMCGPGTEMMRYYDETQLLKMVSVVTRSLASVRE